MKRLAWLVAVAVATAAVPGSVPRAAAQSEDEESQLLLEAARRAIAKKDYARAGELLDKALRANPRRIEVYVLRAGVHGMRKEHGKGIAILEKAQKLAPDNASVSVALGVALVEAGQAERGVPLLETIVAAQPARYDAQVVLGHHYVARAMWSEAVAAFTAYFEHRPRAVAGEDHLHKDDLANAHLRAGDPARARALYEELLAAHPRSERAQLGVAWSVAAIDCREALGLLDELADLERKYAEVSLVRGRCALLVGALDDALAAAERYQEARPDAGDGWALLGDVHDARQDPRAAEAAYTRAVAAEPADPLHAFKLARTERQLGKAQAAVDRLRAAGAPRDFENDWTIEVGEALYALGEPEALRAHLEGWADAHPEVATGQFLLGAALLDLGDLEAAVTRLERAAGGEPRAVRPLVDALNTLAAPAVQAGRLADARALLERADAVGDDLLTWRNLGAVLIAQGAAADVARAVTLLEQAVAVDRRDPVAQHLLARAYQAAGQAEPARRAYGQAIAGYGKDRRAVAARLDLANAELGAGRGEQAVETLEAALAGTRDAGVRATVEQAMVDAARGAATDAMKDGRFGAAVRVLKQVEKRAAGDDAVALRCDLALAATGNGQREAALDHLRKLEKARARCPFVAPADDLAVPILIAWNEGATLRKAKQALERLGKLRAKARGVAEPLARVAARDIALGAAQEAYDAGLLKQAARFLAAARQHDKRSPELAHNQAVIRLAGGDVDGAIRELDAIKDEVPEAYVNLGIAHDRKRNARKAVEAWKKAQAAGIRFKGLDEWIEVKRRLWGGDL